MSEYTFLDVLTPWLILFVLAILVGYAEDWIHRHFFGIGYLLTDGDKMRATVLFYVFFAPGVFVHEIVQYLVAGALSVPIKTVLVWPDQQKDGTMRLDFVVVKRNETDRLRASLVAAAPFVVMGGIVWFVSTEILNLHAFTASLGSGDFEVIWAEFNRLLQAPDFFLWFYLLFVVANTMLPNEADAEGLPLIFGAMGGMIALMLFLGLGNVLLETLGGRVAETIGLVNTALASILVIDIAAIFVLSFLESLVARWRGYRIDYNTGKQKKQTVSASKVREVGSDAPYPAGQPLPSIYNLQLPLPEPIAKVTRPAPSFANRNQPDGEARPAPSFTNRNQQDGEARPAPSFTNRNQQDGEARPAPSFANRNQQDGEARPASSFANRNQTDREAHPASSFANRNQTDREARPAPSFANRNQPDGEARPAPSFANRNQPDGEARPTLDSPFRRPAPKPTSSRGEQQRQDDEFNQDVYGEDDFRQE